MSSKQGHESLESYTDSIRVKISEQYKPPPRINVAMTYAQRLKLNKQTQDNMPNYEFLLEKTILAKMKEWKNVRNLVFEERKLELEKARQELKEKRDLEEIQEKVEEMEVKTVEETVAITNTNNNFISTPTNVAFATNTSINQSYVNYSTNSSILMPTQAAANYSNILTPIPLKNSVNQQYSCKPADKSPFNISDFENDTSSPFDNMELKSINDMEELAQVLKSEESCYKVNTPMYPTYQGTQTSTASQIQPTYGNYLANQYSYNIPQSVSYVQPVTSDYSQTNGYYYSPADVSQNQTFQAPYIYTKPSTYNYDYTVLDETKKSNCKSVPDILKSLQTELESSQLEMDNKPATNYIRTNPIPQTSRPKSTDAVYPKSAAKVEELEDPFNVLPKNQQELCRSISLMGFPLPRVARTCKILGGDHKKIVEHLLALSELLDLGFSEKDVSSVLLQCDNDRDKALDKLIS